MTNRSKAGVGIAGICALAIGVSTVTSYSDGNQMDIITEGGAAQTSKTVTTPENEMTCTTSALSEVHIEKLSETTSDDHDDISIRISFTAVPDEKRSSESEMVFTSDSPQMIIIVPTDQAYSVTEEYSVVGYIEAVTEKVLFLSDCEIDTVLRKNNTYSEADLPEISNTPDRSPATEKSPATTQGITASQPAQGTAQDVLSADREKEHTVYVSTTGKYHSKPNCSGMKTYTEMSRDRADADGHQPCRKCFK